MNKKIVGILVYSLLIATALPVTGTMNINKIQPHMKKVEFKWKNSS